MPHWTGGRLHHCWPEMAAGREGEAGLAVCPSPRMGQAKVEGNLERGGGGQLKAEKHTRGMGTEQHREQGCYWYSEQVCPAHLEQIVAAHKTYCHSVSCHCWTGSGLYGRRALTEVGSHCVHVSPNTQAVSGEHCILSILIALHAVYLSYVLSVRGTVKDFSKKSVVESHWS